MSDTTYKSNEVFENQLPVIIDGNHYTLIDGELFPSIYGGGGYGAIIGTVVGYAVGAVLAPYTGGASLYIGPVLGGVIGRVIDGVTMSSDDDANKPESIQDLAITTAALGQAIPRVVGRYVVAGNIIQTTEKVPHENEIESGGGGGGKGGFGGPTSVTIQTTYTISFALGLCEGPIEKVTRVWTDQTLVYDEANPDGRITLVSSEAISKNLEAADHTQIFTLYRGTEEQEPDPFLQTVLNDQGIDPNLQPGYRGLAYVVIENLDLGTAGRVPNFTFEVQRSRVSYGRIIDIGVLNNGVVRIDDGKQLQSLSLSSLETITAFNAPDDFFSYVALATGHIGIASTTSIVVAARNGDGIDPTTDTLYVVQGDSVLDEVYMGATSIVLRTGSEISGQLSIGVAGIISDNKQNFWCRFSGPTVLVQYRYPGTVILTRFTLGSVPSAFVWQSGGTYGHVFVIRAGNVVDKILPSATTMSLVETLTGFTGPHSVLAASDGKVWVSNNGTNTIAHFTGSVDIATVTVGNGPTVLTEASDGYIWVVNATDKTLSRVHPTAFTVQTFDVRFAADAVCRGPSGAIWATVTTANSVYRISSTGAVTTIRVSAGPFKVLSDSTGRVYVASNTSVVTINPEGTEGYQQAGEGSLACLVYDLCLQVGLDGSQVDVSGLDNTPVNMLINNVQSAKNILETLAQIYSFVGVESEGKIKFAYKSLGGSVADIPENALCANEDKPNTTSLTIQRLQEVDLPTKLSLVYASIARSFHASTQSMQLVNSKVLENPVVVNVPVALEDTHAKNITETLLYDPWINREILGFTLPPMCMILEPFDGISVTARGITYESRIVELSEGHNWLYEGKSVVFDPSVFTDFSTVAGDSSGFVVGLQRQSRAGILLLDVPPLSSTDIPLRYLAVGYPIYGLAGRVFSTATLFNSLDNTTYTTKKTLGSEARVGTVAVALANANPAVWDMTNTISVTLYTSTLTLSSATDLEVLNGGNQCMLGSEVCGFVTATLTAPGVYTLSRLLRGRQGTEWACSTHGTNEQFILLDTTAKNGRVQYQQSDIGISEYYKITDPITGIAQATAFTQTLNGVNLLPWAPGLQPPSRNIPSTDDVTFNWFHRSRLTDEIWVTGAGLVYDPDDTGTYRIRMYSNSSYTTIVRTVTTSSYALASGLRTHVYTSAQQTTDFGSPQSTIYYDITIIATLFGYAARGIV